MTQLRVACGAFLIAVLMCDLTFDLPVWRAKKGDPLVRDAALEAATVYYRRITTRGSPLSAAVAIVMLALLAGLFHDLVFTSGTSLARFAVRGALAAAPISLAAWRTFPSARRLAAGAGDVAARTELASSIARDHLLALPAMLAYVAVELLRL